MAAPHRIVAAICIVLCALAGCGSYMDFKKPLLRNYPSEAMDRVSRPGHTRERRAPAAEEMARALAEWREEQGPVKEAYSVGRGDTISISLTTRHSADVAMTLSAVVSSTGVVGLPLLGKVPVADLTAAEIETRLQELYADGYYKEPVVTVVVTVYASKRLLVAGAVAAPGPITLKANRITLPEALLEAGGATPEAGPVVRLARSKASGAGANRPPKVIEIDLDLLMADPALLSDAWVYPDDVVNVPSQEQVQEYFTVLGYVRAPGLHPYPRDRTIALMEALAVARGLTLSSRPQLVRLVRNGPAGPRIYRIDASRIAAAKEPDVEVLPGDTIIVGTSWIRRTLDGLLHSVGLIRYAPAA